ncbi:MAG: DUF2281 domain-containing protein [Cyclobacteriaceae bacterium]|jgi:Protein of unknown function (DUF2281)
MSTIQLYSRIDSLPADLRKEAEDFIDSLIERTRKEKKPDIRPLGLAKGKISIPDDFDEPLEDFKEYMQ